MHRSVLAVRRGRAKVARPGLEGDEQAGLSVHGGVDKAVYLDAHGGGAWWTDAPGRELPRGILGENITLSGNGVGDVRVGDTFAMGAAVIAAGEPRGPCSTRGARVGGQGLLKRLEAALGPG
jgi:MOSC domain-containing protein YiiM